MRYASHEDKDSIGFELAAFLCVIAASAIAFLVVAGNGHKEVAVVRFIDPQQAGPAVSDETTASIAPARLPLHAPEPTLRPDR